MPSSFCNFQRLLSGKQRWFYNKDKFKFKGFKDGRYTYKNTGSSNLNSVPNFKNESMYNGANNTRPTSLEIGNQD